VRTGVCERLEKKGTSSHARDTAASQSCLDSFVIKSTATHAVAADRVTACGERDDQAPERNQCWLYMPQRPTDVAVALRSTLATTARTAASAKSKCGCSTYTEIPHVCRQHARFSTTTAAKHIN
jgi:hypothetical protein